MGIRGGIILFLSLSLISSAAYIGKLVRDNAKLEQRLAINEKVVEEQNKAIQQLALDSEEYHCSLEDMNNYTRNKYDRVIHEHEDETCEAKLESLEKAFHIFNLN